MKTQQGFKEETATLHRFLDSQPGFSYEEHALLRMRERGLTRQDVKAALRSGLVVGVELAYETEVRWKVLGTDLDGNKLAVIIAAIREDGDLVIVVTAFQPNRPKSQ